MQKGFLYKKPILTPFAPLSRSFQTLPTLSFLFKPHPTISLVSLQIEPKTHQFKYLFFQFEQIDEFTLIQVLKFASTKHYRALFRLPASEASAVTCSERTCERIFSTDDTDSTNNEGRFFIDFSPDESFGFFTANMVFFINFFSKWKGDFSHYYFVKFKNKNRRRRDMKKNENEVDLILAI